MTDGEFEAFARGAHPNQGRRHALKAFGAAALAAVAGMPLAAEAKKNTKKKKRRKKNRRGNVQICPECPVDDCTQEAEQAAAARCQSQIEACGILIQSICGDDPSCLRERRRCCDELGKCDTGTFFVCLTAEDS